MDYQTLLFSKDQGVATITLNRPEQLNAMNRELIEELAAAIEDVSQDEEVRAVIFTGSGDRAFCAGVDLKSSTMLDFKNNQEAVLYIQSRSQTMMRIRQMAKPAIAAINGLALGGGCILAMACDIRIAAEHARFSPGAFTTVGLHADGGGTYFLPRLVGMAKACELLFTGKMIDAREAEKIGFVNQVVPADLLKDTTQKLALSLAQGPPAAIGHLKASIYQSMDMDIHEVVQREALINGILLFTEDHKEGVRAFEEKRKPVFKGR
jgi:2-(1,2-epoxy-1,2-dihydrophenyl)acetyl-CoA isomerase